MTDNEIPAYTLENIHKVARQLRGRVFPEECEHDYEMDEERGCLYCPKCDHPPKDDV